MLCTVRYVGHVTGTTGEWLGVEWDDPNRGKHDGTYQEVKYFECTYRKKMKASSYLEELAKLRDISQVNANTPKQAHFSDPPEPPIHR